MPLHDPEHSELTIDSSVVSSGVADSASSSLLALVLAHLALKPPAAPISVSFSSCSSTLKMVPFA